MSEESPVEKLMHALISKMEVMDGNIVAMKQENDRLRAIINNPHALLRKAGLMAVRTPLSEDLSVDPFRADLENNTLLKGEQAPMYKSNEEIHQMSWEEIHEIAQSAKTQEVA